jgi:hypothetical protein
LATRPAELLVALVHSLVRLVMLVYWIANSCEFRSGA